MKNHDDSNLQAWGIYVIVSRAASTPKYTVSTSQNLDSNLLSPSRAASIQNNSDLAIALLPSLVIILPTVYRYGRYNAGGMTTPDSAVASTNDGDGDTTTAPDALRISADEFRATYDQAFTQWAVLHASAVKNPGLPSIDLSASLRHVPRFPRKFAVEGAVGCVYVRGSSVWGTSSLLCLHPPAPIELEVRLEVASTDINTLVTETPPGGLYTPWFGSGPNYVAVLALAWSYILSARWAEVMPAGTVAYIASEEDIDNKDGHQIVVEIGDAGEEEAQWWSAILQPGAGWKASMELDGETFLSPWSVQRQGSHHFTLTGGPSATATHTASTPAASFADARRFLQKFVNRHDIAHQSQAALAAVFLFPEFGGKKTMKLSVSSVPSETVASDTPPTSPTSTNTSPNSAGSPESLTLPDSPNSSGSPDSSSSPDTSFCPDHGWEVQDADIDKLLVLACSGWNLRSILMNIFFDPSVPCNASSASLQGQAAAIKKYYQDGPIVLGQMLIERSPQAAFLWLGMVILGDHDRIYDALRYAMMPLDLTSAGWSGTTQSFLLEPTLKKPADTTFPRADECKLLYLCQEVMHRRLPLGQWRPIGDTPVEDVDLEVRQHANCYGHQLRYQGFRWAGEEERQQLFLHDVKQLLLWLWPLVRHRVASFLAEPKSCEHAKMPVLHDEITYDGMDIDNDSTSANASRMILTWLRMDGWTRYEREMATHDWVDIFGDEEYDEEEEENEETASIKAADKRSEVNRWMASIS